MEKQESQISVRLSAIADALETASKQARLLAAEVEISSSVVITTESVLRAIGDIETKGQASLDLKHP